MVTARTMICCPSRAVAVMQESSTKVIGYFAYTRTKAAICQGDSCIIAGSEQAIAASKTYSSIMAYTGATRELVQFVTGLEMPGIYTLIVMMLILMVLGTFMEQVSMMMITIPIFLPVIYGLGFDPIWFAVLMLLNLEMAMSTPPFGMLLFVMKGSAPGGTTIGDICIAALPFLACDLIIMVLIIAFPSIPLFLPSLM